MGHSLFKPWELYTQAIAIPIFLLETYIPALKRFEHLMLMNVVVGFFFF